MHSKAYERKAWQNERTDLSLDASEILCASNTGSNYPLATPNTHMPAPHTHFHQQLQLKHQTTDIHGYFNNTCCSFTIIMLLCYVITLFTSLLIDTVNIVLSLLNFTHLLKVWFLRLITYYTVVHIYHQQQLWHLQKWHKQSITVPKKIKQKVVLLIIYSFLWTSSQFKRWHFLVLCLKKTPKAFPDNTLCNS